MAATLIALMVQPVILTCANLGTAHPAQSLVLDNKVATWVGAKTQYATLIIAKLRLVAHVKLVAAQEQRVMVAAPASQILIVEMEVVTAATLPPTVQAIAAQLAVTEFAMAAKVAAIAQAIADFALIAEMEAAIMVKLAMTAWVAAVPIAAVANPLI